MVQFAPQAPVFPFRLKRLRFEPEIFDRTRIPHRAPRVAFDHRTPLSCIRTAKVKGVSGLALGAPSPLSNPLGRPRSPSTPGPSFIHSLPFLRHLPRRFHVFPSSPPPPSAAGDGALRRPSPRSVRGARHFRGWKLRRGLARRDDGRNLVGCDAAAVHLRTFLGLKGVLVCLRVGDGGGREAWPSPGHPPAPGQRSFRRRICAGGGGGGGDRAARREATPLGFAEGAATARARCGRGKARVRSRSEGTSPVRLGCVEN